MENIVVINCGSQTIRAGLAANFPSDSEPRVVLPSAVHDTSQPISDEAHSSGVADADAGSSQYPVIKAMDDGAVVNWDAYESLLYYILYNQLGWEVGDEGNVMYAEQLFISKGERERVTQLMFELFNVSGLFIADEALLSLYAMGKLTGIVVDLGHTKTDVSAVFEGQTYTASMRRLPYGGRDLTKYLGSLLSQRDIHGLSQAQLEYLKTECMTIKESGEEFATTMNEDEGSVEEYALPDGQRLQLGREGIRLGEALMQGDVLGFDVEPLSECVYNAVQWHQETATRKQWMENVAVVGGGSGVTGVNTRINKDLRILCPMSYSPASCLCPDYLPDHALHYAAWMGGAVLSKVVFQQTQQQQHISKGDYEEVGPYIAHRKCG